MRIHGVKEVSVSVAASKFLGINKEAAMLLN